jgi:hypothetical protein
VLLLNLNNTHQNHDGHCDTAKQLVQCR